MKQYLNALRHVMIDGEVKNDRTGTGVISSFDVPPMVFELKNGFPLVTTKKMFVRGIIEELLWMIGGDTNVRTLQEKGVHIWDKNYEAFRMKTEEEAAHFGCLPEQGDGDLGPIYGKQWRSVRRFDMVTGDIHVIDQLDRLIYDLKNNPNSRRLLVDSWNVAELDMMALPPCHCLFQCYVRQGIYLDLKLYQRSADMFLGVPFNIASYSLLTMMLAQQTGLLPGRFIHVLGDAHIYKNHIAQVEEQCKRTPHQLPKMTIAPAATIEDYTTDNFHLDNYICEPELKGEMSV